MATRRTIVIGDIHGCFDELTDLLDLVKFTSKDRVVAVGDLIVKGQKNAEVLDLSGRWRSGPAGYPGRLERLPRVSSGGG